MSRTFWALGGAGYHRSNSGTGLELPTRFPGRHEGSTRGSPRIEVGANGDSLYRLEWSKGI
jgi:hypothetical protein